MNSKWCRAKKGSRRSARLTRNASDVAELTPVPYTERLLGEKVIASKRECMVEPVEMASVIHRERRVPELQNK